MKLIQLGIVVLMFQIIAACTPSNEPKKLKLHSDKCAECRMPISDARFASQLITVKGRHYMFDDIICLKAYIRNNPNTEISQKWVADFTHTETFIAIDEAYFISAEGINSPMLGNMAAFSDVYSAERMGEVYRAKVFKWSGE